MDLVEHIVRLLDNVLRPSLHPPDLPLVFVPLEQDGEMGKYGDCFLGWGSVF